MIADFRSRQLLLVGLAVVVAAGCGTSTPDYQPDATVLSDTYFEPDWQARYDWGQPPLQEACQTPTNRLLHLASWPGLGLGILVGITDELGDPVQDLAESWFGLASVWGIPIPLAAAPATLTREYLLVLLAPGDAASSLPLTQLRPVLESLPAPVDVALFLACDGVTQLAGFGSGRENVVAQLTTLEATCESPGDLWAELAQAVLEAEHIGGPALPALRSVVVVGGSLGAAPVPLPFAGTPVQLLHWTAESEGFPVTAVTHAGALTERLEAGRKGLHFLGACPDLTPGDAVTLTAEDGANCPFLLPEGPGELETMACSADAIVANEHPPLRRVEFVFSPEEREIYDDKVKAKDQNDFSLQIKLGQNPPVKATAHLRGQTSLDCVRKSYTVNLKGNRGRHILPESATDEFYLISMCKDDRYFQQYTANLLAAPLGLFPLKFGLVELLLDGETRGVYLLLEKTKEALLEDHSRVLAVIRRRFDPGQTPAEVNYPSGGSIDGPAGAAYSALAEIGQKFSGGKLLDELNRRMDFDQFLRILAFQTLMGNGDYVDEVIFYSSEAVRGGETLEWFQTMAWDMDDLYSACHHGGKHAMLDPHEILYCAEGNLEKSVMPDAAVYARFIHHLESLINETLTADHVDSALDQTAADLLPFFDDPEVCAAMVGLVAKNPEAVAPETAKADIQSHMDAMRGQYAARRDKLKARIEAYHARGGD